MRILITSVAVLTCAAALAQFEYVRDNTPLRHWHIDMATGQGREVPLGGDVITQSTATVYSNITNFTGYVATGGNRADDLHMVIPPGFNIVSAFTFVYQDPAGGAQLWDVPITFYVGGPADPPPGAVLASFLISGLPGDGHWIITVTLPPTMYFTTPAHIWAGMDLTAPSRSHARHSIWHPPTVGSSCDVFYRFDGTPGFYWFGGMPVASFGWEIKTVPEPGTLAAIGVGLAGLLALRRRK